MEWTCQDHTTKRNKCVTNMSLGGGKSAAVNAAVDAMVRCGCSSAIASGNEARDACNSSPASAELGFTVNAMDNTDTNAWFSNYGTCTQM
jgi:subtilisin family serine protease